MGKKWDDLTKKEKETAKNVGVALGIMLIFTLFKEHYNNSTKTQKIKIWSFWLLFIILGIYFDDYKDQFGDIIVGLFWLNIIWGIINLSIRGGVKRNIFSDIWGRLDLFTKIILIILFVFFQY
jgi:hypothetical protein